MTTSGPVSELLAEIRRRLGAGNSRAGGGLRGGESGSARIQYPEASNGDLWMQGSDVEDGDSERALVDRFVEAARARGAEVSLAAYGTAGAVALDWLAGIGAKKVAVWPELAQPDASGGPPWFSRTELLSGGRGIADNPESADAGIVRADLGVALTGSVAFRNGGSRERLASLLPPAAVFLLRARDIVPTLRVALDRLGKEGPLPSCVNFVTGPSSSADLEGDIFVGVHGPGRVLVIVAADG